MANSITGLNNSLNECFQSVSSGKTKVAAAITGKGVSTAATATFDVMANNIKAIRIGLSTWSLGSIDIGGYKGTTFSVNATAIPNWRSLTTANFVLDFQWFKYISGGGSNNLNSYTKSYNPANGILTITNSMSQPSNYGSNVMVHVIALH